MPPEVSSNPLIAGDYDGTYNAMQLVFRRRQRSGLKVSSSYTLAHAVQTNAAPWNVSIVERYDSDFDVRHRFGCSDVRRPDGRDPTAASGRGLQHHGPTRFAKPNWNFGTARSGTITRTGSAISRQMQFAVKLLF